MLVFYYLVFSFCYSNFLHLIDASFIKIYDGLDRNRTDIGVIYRLKNWEYSSEERKCNIYIEKLNLTFPKFLALEDSKHKYQNRRIADFIKITFSFLSSSEINFHLEKMANDTVFSLNSNLENNEISEVNSENGDLPNFDYLLELYRNPFAFRVIRSATNESIFDISDSEFFLMENLTMISTKIQTNLIFGFGQRFSSFLLKPNNFTLWNKDNAGSEKETATNTYGSHPVYLLREKSKNYHIVLLNNSNAMEIEYTKSKMLHYRLLGGSINFTIFLGNKYPEAIVKKYHAHIGKTALHPFYSMGFFQSRYGYNKVERLEFVANKFFNEDIPLEGFFLDIDIYEDYQPFVINKNAFPFSRLKNLKEQFDLKLIAIVEPVIAKSVQKYKNNVSNSCQETPFEKAIRYDVLLKDEKNELLTGNHWAGSAYIPDFIHPNVTYFWEELLICLQKDIPFDGIWLDMNEISIFKSRFVNTMEYFVQKDYYPYLPKDLNKFGLSESTININIKHYNGVFEADIHNKINLYQAEATYNVMRNQLNNPLPFIITRSNTFGTNRFASVWSGDNFSSKEHLYLSISSIFNHNLFGFTMSGVDICGFLGNANPTLCGRWLQFGALYPFSRNHNFNLAMPQEPYFFDDKIKEGARKNIKLKYSLLKYYYSIYLENNGTGTVFKPLFFEYFDDEECYRREVMETQFLIGKDLIVIPILDINYKVRYGYLPSKYIFYDYHSGKKVDLKGYISLANELNEKVPVYMRGGSVIMSQSSSKISNTNDLDENYKMKIALDANLEAKGSIMGVTDTSEQIIYDFCYLKSCLVDIEAKFEGNFYEIRLKWRDEETYKLLISKKIRLIKLKEIRFFTADEKFDKFIRKSNLKINNENYQFRSVVNKNDSFIKLVMSPFECKHIFNTLSFT